MQAATQTTQRALKVESQARLGLHESLTRLTMKLLAMSTRSPL